MISPLIYCLPTTISAIAERIESVADWCDGFVQGFFHDDWGGAGVNERPHESIADIMEISRLTPQTDTDADATDRQLSEIEEYLRVAVQTLFDEQRDAQTDVKDALVN